MDTVLLSIKFNISSFDEVEVEFYSFKSLNNFLRDNRILSDYFGYSKSKGMPRGTVQLRGEIVVRLNKPGEKFTYTFKSYREFEEFLHNNPNCARDLGHSIGLTVS